METRLRGTIIKTPDNSPGLLIVDGQQKRFTLENVWKSPVAPAVNMPVDIEFDGAGSIAGLTSVDPQKEARGKTERIGGVAQETGKDATAIASQGASTLLARIGKVTAVATVILWIAWFYLPALTVAVPFLGPRTFTAWEILSLDLNNQLTIVPGSSGLLNILGLVALAAPLAVPFMRHPLAKFLYAMPLAFVLLFAATGLWKCDHAISEAADMVKRNVTPAQGNPRWNELQARSMEGVEDRLEEALAKSASISYGIFVIFITSLVLAGQVFRRSASARAGSSA